jgi:hypothetical protein
VDLNDDDASNWFYKQYLAVEGSVSGPVSCGLTGVSGDFSSFWYTRNPFAPLPDPWTNGALIEPAPAGGGFWTLTLRNGAAAWTRCLW